MATAATTPVASTGGVHPKDTIDKISWVVILFAVVLVFAFGIKREVESKERASLGFPQAMQPAVMELTAPPNGDSPSISGPNGSIVSFTGKDFVMHCVYTDGRDESYPCSTGNGLIKQYIHDTSGKKNTVVYKFVRPH